MPSRIDTFLAKNLGEDFLDSLSKTELWKPGTRSVTDIDDMKIGLRIVPRTIISLLVRELTPMEIGESKEIDLHGLRNMAKLKVTKHERDVYSGDIEENNKKVTEFKFRSIPGVGLVIMSAFELYQWDEEKSETPIKEDEDKKLQRMIDERLALHDLIGKVVDKKIMEREAIHELVLTKLSMAIDMVGKKVENMKENSVTIPILTEKSEETKPKKIRPLQKFLEKRKKPKEFAFSLAKGESVSCPDCGNNIFDGSLFSTCICYGDSGKVFLKKTEDGFKIRFSKNWDVENIEMLLDVLREKNNND